VKGAGKADAIGVLPGGDERHSGRALARLPHSPGYLAFGELPIVPIYLGATIISGAGLFVICRERRPWLGSALAVEAVPASIPKIMLE
jgi:hypothetical protein